jgi:hypothetical protein
MKIRYLRIAFFLASLIPAKGSMYAYAQQVSSAKYICKDLEGKKRWEASNTIVRQKEKDLYVLTEEGTGVYFGFDEPVRWKAQAEFLDDGAKITPLRVKKVFYSQVAGKALFEGTQEYDPAKGEVTYQKKWLDPAKETRKTLRYDGDVVNEFLLGMYTERFLKNGDRDKVFYLVSNDPSIYKVTAKVIGEEEVVVNGHTLKSYKLSLDPEVGLFGFLAPKTYVWHLTSGQCNWLKYRGAEDTIDSPEVEMETLDR